MDQPKLFLYYPFFIIKIVKYTLKFELEYFCNFLSYDCKVLKSLLVLFNLFFEPSSESDVYKVKGGISCCAPGQIPVRAPDPDLFTIIILES